MAPRLVFSHGSSVATDAAIVVLTWSEVAQAALAGVLRHVESKQLARPDAHGAEDEDGWGIDIEGAAGELAVAKCLDRYWCGKGKFRGADLGPWQVRTAASHEDCLILRRGDRDGEVFILVTGTAPRFRVRGWIRGVEGKREEYARNPHGRGVAWFVPVTRLHPIETLPCDPRPVPSAREPGEDG